MRKTFLTQKFNKIPILITKDDEHIGYRVEVPHNYDDYKPAKFEDLEFEDINHHFHLKCGDKYIFPSRKIAKEEANFVNEKYLKNNGEIWF